MIPEQNGEWSHVQTERMNEWMKQLYSALLYILVRGQWGEFGQDTGVTPYSLQEVPWDF